MEDVKVVVAHHERVTLRVGDVFLKIDADQSRTDIEVEAMALAPVPAGRVRYCRRPGGPQHSSCSPGTSLAPWKIC